LIIAGPDLPQGNTNEALCEMVDLTPTVLELLGVQERYPHSGKSLVRTIRDNLPEHKEYAFSEGGFLVKEEPLLEHAGFPYDRKAGLQHEDTELVGRAVGDASYSTGNEARSIVADLYRCRLGTKTGRTHIGCTSLPSSSTATKTVSGDPASSISRMYQRALVLAQLKPSAAGEAHNLADLPEHAATCLRFERAIMRWMVETSDYVPWEKDPRFPEVTLESTKSQMEKRRAAINGKFNH
jgi:hypothetical protein